MNIEQKRNIVDRQIGIWKVEFIVRELSKVELFRRAFIAEQTTSNFILESPFEPHQIALIAEFGKRVSLSEIHPDCMAYIESQIIIGCSPIRY